MPPVPRVLPAAYILASLQAQQYYLQLPASFRARYQALTQLEYLLWEPEATATRLHQAARQLQQTLEAADTRLLRNLRQAIQANRYPAAFWQRLLQRYDEAQPADFSANPGYDALDSLVNGLLLPVPHLTERFAGQPGLAHFQATPARIIRQLAAQLTPHDTLVDLGSGLGHVPLLVRLLSGAATWGVELEPAYCAYAAGCAADWQLSGVHFRCADARTVDLATCTAVYLYSPCTGPVLAQLLARLQQQAHYQPLRVFSYGPLNEHLAQLDWLQSVQPVEPGTPEALAAFVTTVASTTS